MDSSTTASQLRAGLSGKVLVAGVWTAAIATAVVTSIAASGIAGARWLPVFVAVSCVAIMTIGAVVVPHRREWDAFSPLGLICLFYFATFVVGGIYFYVNPWPGPQPYEQSDIASAIALAAVSLAFLAVGYAANPLRRALRVVPRLPSKPQTTQAFALLVSLLLVGWLARVYEFETGHYFYNDLERGGSTGLSWLMGTLAALPLLAAAYSGSRYYLAKRAGTAYRSTQRQYYALFSIEMVYSAPRGSRAAILTILMMMLVLRYYGLRKRPSVSSILAVSVLAVLVVFPLLYAYRNTGGPAGYQQNLRQNIGTSVGALLGQSPSEALSSGLDSTFERFAGARTFAAVLHYGPEAMDRKPGETLSWASTAFLPRAIAPGKPDPGTFGNEFGRNYALVNSSDYRTAVTLVPAAELYMNYRLPGIVIGMFFVGALYRLLGIYFAGRRTHAGALAVYAISAWPLINAQESILAGGLMGTIKTMAVLAFVLILFGRVQQVRLRRI